MAYATSVLPDKRSDSLLAAQQANPHTRSRRCLFQNRTSVGTRQFPTKLRHTRISHTTFYTILYQHIYTFVQSPGLWLVTELAHCWHDRSTLRICREEGSLLGLASPTPGVGFLLLRGQLTYSCSLFLSQLLMLSWLVMYSRAWSGCFPQEHQCNGLPDEQFLS